MSHQVNAYITGTSDRAIDGAVHQVKCFHWDFSHKLTTTEQHCSTYNRELLAIYNSSRHFIHLLESKDLRIYTDHKLLTHIFQQK